MSEQTLSKEIQEIWVLAKEVARRQEEMTRQIEKLSKKFVPSTDECFLSDEWQKGEQEADEAIANGETVGPFDNISDALQALKTVELYQDESDLISIYRKLSDGEKKEVHDFVNSFVSGEKEDPWEEFAGMFANNPDFDRVMKEAENMWKELDDDE